MATIMNIIGAANTNTAAGYAKTNNSGSACWTKRAPRYPAPPT